MAVNCSYENDPADAATDPDTLISVRSPAEAVTKRDALNDYLWSGAGFPFTRQPDSVLTTGVNYRVLTYQNVQAARKLTFTVGTHSLNPTLLVPRVSSNILALVIQGHTATYDSIGVGDTVRGLLLRGCHVLECELPLYGFNTGGDATHNAMEALEDPGVLSVIKYFLEDKIGAINYVLANYLPHPNRIICAGVSGGGWVAMLLAACDWRVTHTFPVTAVMPLYLRAPLAVCGVASENPTGDFEQGFDPLLDVCNDLDQMVLACANGRLCHLGYNQLDPSAFRGIRYQLFEAKVQKAASAAGGDFRVLIGPTENTHAIGARHQRHIWSATGIGEAFHSSQDGGDASRVGSWSFFAAGYNSDMYQIGAGSGANSATWTFTVTPGIFTVLVTYTINANRATNVPYTVYDDTVALATVTVNQEVAPNQPKDSSGNDPGGHTGWQLIGTYEIQSTTLKVVVTDNCPGQGGQFLIANGARVIKLNNAPTTSTQLGVEPIVAAAPLP